VSKDSGVLTIPVITAANIKNKNERKYSKYLRLFLLSQ
jgi:hypothetical protein